MQSRWCRGNWQGQTWPTLCTSSAKEALCSACLSTCRFYWRDLESKSKSTAYLLLVENWNSSTTAPAALFSPWWASMAPASSDRLCCSSRRASAALLLWVPALIPRTHAWKITHFAARGLLMSAQHCLVFVQWVSNLGESTVKEANRSFDRSRSKVRGPTLPATRSNHQVGYADNRV